MFGEVSSYTSALLAGGNISDIQEKTFESCILCLTYKGLRHADTIIAF